MMPGLKINLLRSEVLSIEGDNNTVQTYVDVFHCQVENFPMIYVGGPISSTGLKICGWDFV